MSPSATIPPSTAPVAAASADAECASTRLYSYLFATATSLCDGQWRRW